MKYLILTISLKIPVQFMYYTVENIKNLFQLSFITFSKLFYHIDRFKCQSWQKAREQQLQVSQTGGLFCVT